MTTAVKTAIQSVPDLHSHFQGNAEQVITKLAKSNSIKTSNKHLEPKIEKIPTDKLVPLESQRVTKDTWAQKRLQALGGLDMWAFGTLSVCRDPRDNVNYVWDGCGRLALAQLHGLKEVPCVVIEGEKERAAFYFGYNQDSTQGRRTLSKEVLFVNRYYSGDATAIAESNLLDRLGLYVKGDTDYAVPNPQPNGHIEIGYRAFSEGQGISGNNFAIQRQARDMIVTAWSNNPLGCHFINQDIYWAMLELLKSIPETRKNGVNVALQQFLINLATGRDQKRVDWKDKGLSGNSGVSKQLAAGLLRAFKESSYWKPGFNNTLTFKKIVD
jgi:hypothetical protein